MQLFLLFIQQIGSLAKFIQRVIVDLFNMGWTKSNIRFLNEIPGIEDKLHYRINLFSFDEAFGYKRYAQYISKRFYPEEINLLFWDGRYAWIKHFSRLFADTTKCFAVTI